MSTRDDLWLTAVALRKEKRGVEASGMYLEEGKAKFSGLREVTVRKAAHK